MKLSPELEKYRVRRGLLRSDTADTFGAFMIPGPCGIDLKVIASCGDAKEEVFWEHVSVSTRNRCPNWAEMCFVKNMFWDGEETVMQLHPPPVAVDQSASVLPASVATAAMGDQASAREYSRRAAGVNQ